MAERLKAILVGVNFGNDFDFEDSMAELAGLARACEIEPAGEVTQRLESMNAAYYIGSGKIEEVISALREKNAEMAIFNDELSPSQIRNLENALNCNIIDRTALILDIFAQRARTKEAKLQVEIAQMHYMLPRLAGIGQSLSRQGGGRGGGAGFINRGAGETKLELDRRRIQRKISQLEKELEELVLQRKNQRKMRKKNQIPVIALVGYTNAGKSTVMNALMEIYNSPEEKKVFEKDMLFATLQTAVRKITLPDNKSFLLTDTVGFISKLPHQLVKAFRSTLEEVTEADMIVHVVDYSNPNYNRQIEVTNKTLEEIGVKNIPIVYAFNKIDMVEGEVPKDGDDCVYISATRKIGLDNLVRRIISEAFPEYIECEMLLPYEKGSIVSYFLDHASVFSCQYVDEGVRLAMKCPEADYRRYKEYVISNSTMI